MKKKLIAFSALLVGPYLSGNAEAGTVLTYNDFSSTSGYTRYGTAVNSGNDLQLTSINVEKRAGSVFFHTPVDVTSFNSSFSFSFDGTSTNGADGLVFVIKNKESSNLGGTGGLLGYDGINRSVGVEIDTHRNDPGVKYNDIDHNHIGIDINGNIRSESQASVSQTFNSNGVWYAWLDYDGAILSVYLNQQNSKPGSATLTYGSSAMPFVIKDYVGSSSGLVGFTAATGAVTQTALLKSFNHNSPNPEPSTYVLMGVGMVIAGIAARKKIVSRQVIE